MSHRVVFSPEAADQLLHLYTYIARAASPSVAARYTDAIVAYCDSLNTLPHRGVQRDDIRPGLRITDYRKRAVIAFAVDAEQVSILGIYYGGRDYESLLRVESEDDPAL
jgi:plasmid stabilization system protein ParE